MENLREKISLLRFFISLLSTALLAMVGWLFISFEQVGFLKALVCGVAIILLALVIALLLFMCLNLINRL